MARRTLSSIAFVLLTFLPCSTTGAQETYQLTGDTLLLNGCIGPSPCDCLGLPIGEVQGSFRLTPLLPPLGPIFEYLVDEVDWAITPTGPNPTPAQVIGNGIYRIDLGAGTHEMVLDLVLDGALRQFSSIAFVPGGAAFPAQLDIDVFSPVDVCIYDGFTIRALHAGADFRRGDCNGDGFYDLADAVWALTELFIPGTPSGSCADACDANDDGQFNVADPVFALNDLFLSGPPPADPFAECGQDPTSDGLGCLEFSPCP